MNALRTAGILLVGLSLAAPAFGQTAQERLKQGKLRIPERWKYDEAITQLTEAIRLDPKNVEAYFCRGEAYRSIVEAAKAIADYDEAIRLDPKLVKAFADCRGRAHYVKMEFGNALGRCH